MQVISYSIYHSSNSYLGILDAYHKLSPLPIELIRRPIFIPKDRGVLVTDFLGGKENKVRSSYNREDSQRWAKKLGIPISIVEPEQFEQWKKRWAQSTIGREELPARIYYAALGTGREEALDKALYRAAFVKGQDVNEESVVRRAIGEARLNADQLMAQAFSETVSEKLSQSLSDFEADQCPGVPTWILNGERFWGKDRLDLLIETIKEQI